MTVTLHHVIIEKYKYAAKMPSAIIKQQIFIFKKNFHFKTLVTTTMTSDVENSKD